MIRPLAVLVGATLAGCASAGQRAAEPCEPSSGSLSFSGMAAEFAGDYRMTFVATSGRRSGARTTARLTLAPAPGAVLNRLPGTSDLVSDSIGAIAAGSVVAADPAAPGVLLLDDAALSGGRSIILRFGADANREGVVRFDGAHLAATVRAVSASGFQGSWTSGDGRSNVAAGHFCARRAG